MTIQSDKPLKSCPHCGKNVKNLGFHVANNHPSIIAQLEEKPPSPPPETPTLTPYSNKNAGVSGVNTQSINEMIREKLDTMLNIKIIEMLSKNPNTSLQEISQAINPPKPSTLQELKEYHELVYGREERELPETGNGWVDLATAAIPLIREMLPAKKKQMEEENKNVELGSDEKRSIRILKPIQAKIAGDREESGSSSNESGSISGESKQDDRSFNTFN